MWFMRAWMERFAGLVHHLKPFVFFYCMPVYCTYVEESLHLTLEAIEGAGHLRYLLRPTAVTKQGNVASHLPYLQLRWRWSCRVQYALINNNLHVRVLVSPGKEMKGYIIMLKLTNNNFNINSADDVFCFYFLFIFFYFIFYKFYFFSFCFILHYRCRSLPRGKED